MFFAGAKIYSPQAMPNAAGAAQPHQQPHPSEDRRLRLHRAVAPVEDVNPNIMSIDIGCLKQSNVSLLTGDPNVCSSCGAVYNAVSKLSSEGLWSCEFCDHETRIGELEEEEIPKEEILDFLLSPGGASSSASNQHEATEEIIIFVVDISGSMCVTTEIAGNLKLRGDKSRTNAIVDQFNHGNRNDQYLPGQRRDVTYVSRLQCVQAAIQSQIQVLSEQKPGSKVGLITFNNEVTIYGDGTTSSVIAGDKLYNFEALLAIGKQSTVEKPVSQSASVLINNIYSLQETGSTALGPALAVALGMCQGKPGAKIVLATDGLANTGVGAMDTDQQIEEATTFYAKISTLAKEEGLMANVIGIRGDNLNLNLIGQIADTTQGDVNLVDPQNITETFSSILDNVIVATNVSVKLIMHKGFELSDQDTAWTVDPRGIISRDVGNGYEDSEITVEFKQKAFGEISKLFDSKISSMVVEEKEEKEEKEEPEVEIEEKEEKEEKEPKEEKVSAIEIPSQLPFQVQITYTSLTGQKCLRVITKCREVTDDAAEIANDLDVAVLGMHANVQTAFLARQGKFAEVEKQQRGYTSLMERNACDEETASHYGAWKSTTSDFSNAIQQQQQQQHQLDELLSEQVPFSQVPRASHAYVSNNDETSNAIYRNRNARMNKKQWSSSRKHK